MQVYAPRAGDKNQLTWSPTYLSYNNLIDSSGLYFESQLSGIIGAEDIFFENFDLDYRLELNSSLGYTTLINERIRIAAHAGMGFEYVSIWDNTINFNEDKFNVQLISPRIQIGTGYEWGLIQLYLINRLSANVIINNSYTNPNGPINIENTFIQFENWTTPDGDYFTSYDVAMQFNLRGKAVGFFILLGISIPVEEMSFTENAYLMQEQFTYPIANASMSFYLK